MLIVLLAVPLDLVVIVILLLLCNQRALIPGTRNYLRVQQEREARHQLMLSRLRAIEANHLETTRALEVTHGD